MLLALSYVTYVFIGWFKFLLLKFLYEYWPRVQHYAPLPLTFYHCASYYSTNVGHIIFYHVLIFFLFERLSLISDCINLCLSPQRGVLEVLCTVITDCKNFKVRINAAVGLSAPQTRAQFGDVTTYCKVWDGITAAFGTAENIAEFIDFKYRDNLVEQVSSACCLFVGF